MSGFTTKQIVVLVIRRGHHEKENYTRIFVPFVFWFWFCLVFVKKKVRTVSDENFDVRGVFFGGRFVTLNKPPEMVSN